MKFIDLFAGIGGFHLGLHRLGLECVFASEIDETARISYQKNFEKISPKLFTNGMFKKDIMDVSTKDIPDFDICCAGFPCQPFSQIGKRKGFNEILENRGNLFFEIARIIKDKRPRVFFLENVQHIVKHNNGNTFLTIQNTLKDLDYSFYYKVIRASDFNLPQLRPRTFMVGFSNEKSKEQNFTFPKPIPLKQTMSDILGGECDRKIGFTLRLGGAGSRIDDRRNWDSYMLNNEIIRITPEHGKKMQGFPKNFYLSDSRTKSMRLLGNSVAVNVVEKIGRQILLYLNDKESFMKKDNTQTKLF